jgi:hypothetical protein
MEANWAPYFRKMLFAFGNKCWRRPWSLRVASLEFSHQFHVRCNIQKQTKEIYAVQQLQA